MTQFPLPDPLPLREILRGLRHGMRRSRRSLREADPSSVLPGPAAAVARPVLDGLDVLAETLDAAGTHLAKRLLGGEAHRVAAFASLVSDPGHEELLAQAIYAGLRGALQRMGDGDAFVSEAAARRARASVVGVVGVGPTPGEAEIAADLALALAEGRVVRDVAPNPGLRVPSDRVAALAVAAAVLWLLADREGADAESALDAATDIVVSVADEVAPAVATRDRARLASVFHEFASHV